METKYYVDQNGVYQGGWQGEDQPTGLVEVATAPEDARQVWNGTAWSNVPKVYREITARQLRLALLSIGIHEADVDMKLVNDPAGMVEWKYASYYKRSHPLVDGLGPLFGITPEQIDSLWLWAQEL